MHTNNAAENATPQILTLLKMDADFHSYYVREELKIGTLRKFQKSQNAKH